MPIEMIMRLMQLLPFFKDILGGQGEQGEQGGPTPFQSLFERQAQGSVSRNLAEQFGVVNPISQPRPITPNINTNVQTVGPLATVSTSGIPVFQQGGPQSKVALPVTGNPDLGFRPPRQGHSATEAIIDNNRRRRLRSRTPELFPALPTAPRPEIIKPGRR